MESKTTFGVSEELLRLTAEACLDLIRRKLASQGEGSIGIPPGQMPSFMGAVPIPIAAFGETSCFGELQILQAIRAYSTDDRLGPLALPGIPELLKVVVRKLKDELRGEDWRDDGAKPS